MDNADKVHGTLKSSAKSRFGGVAHWLGLLISFPRKQQGDFTLEKYKHAVEQAEKDPETGEIISWGSIYGDHGPTPNGSIRATHGPPSDD